MSAASAGTKPKPDKDNDRASSPTPSPSPSPPSTSSARLSPERTIFFNAIVGGLAATCASACTHPIDLFKVRLQLHGELSASTARASIIGKLRELVHNEGWRGLYNGVSATLLRQAIFSTARFGCYEKLRQEITAAHRKRRMREIQEAGAGAGTARSSSAKAAAGAGGALSAFGGASADFGTLDKLFAATFSGAFGGLLSTPADLIMVRMQAEGHNKRKASAPLPAGTTGGAGVNVSSVSVSGSVSASSAVEHRIHAEKVRNYSNVFSAVYRITRDEGLAALWRGTIPNCQRAFVVTGSQFVSYDYFKVWLLGRMGRPDSFATHLMASCMAGIVVATVASPVDVIRTRVMNSKRAAAAAASATATSVSASASSSASASVSAATHALSYSGSWDCFVKILRTEGPLGFWKGLIPYYARVGPQVTFMFVFYEQFYQLLLPPALAMQSKANR